MAPARAGCEVEYPSGGPGVRPGGEPVAAYVVDPAQERGRGVVVVDERGLTDATREVCDRLARAGFVALVPDLYGGRVATGAAEAETLARALDVERAARDLDGAVVELYGRLATTGDTLGALGFGMGGQLALLSAGRNRRIGAVVDLYGSHASAQPDLGALEAPVLAIFAGDDDATPPTAVRSLEADLRRSGVRASVQVRSGVGRGFMDDSRPDVHDAGAAAECWDALLAFLRAELA